MEDLLRLIAGYLRGMWRYRWWGLVVAWLVGIAGGVFVYQMPDRYTSTARVFVDTQSVLRPLMSGLAVQPNVGQQVAILSRTLITRPNVEKLITMADLDLEVRTPDEREALIGELMSGLRIADGGRGGGSNLFSLRYEDSDPERAQRIVQALMSLFVESGLVGKRQDTATARRFIDDQIRAYEQRLTEAENRMTEFRIRHMGMLGPGAGTFVSQIGETMERLEQARLELREAENVRDSLAQQLKGQSSAESRPAIDPSLIPLPEFDSRIEQLRQQLDGMLLRFTDEHPDVIITRRMIEDIERQKAEVIELRSQSQPETEGHVNPVYQQTQFALGQAESQVVVLRTRVEELERRLDALRDNAQLRPQLEAELVQLDRDYNIHKRNYEALVQRRETATMSADMEAQSGITQFRVIDPPTLPTSPSAPNRILLVGIAGVIALAAGVGLTFLLSQLRPAVTDGRALREFTGLPVLGSISLLPDARRVRRERLGLVAFSGGLIGFAGLMSATAIAIQYLQG
ncbi:MAG TPA: GNVR domain-containing protein [Rhodocyclaceae bacterium]|nr:GNVR domain-containing protein [Rhodocyclaceae bacterium]